MTYHPLACQTDRVTRPGADPYTKWANVRCMTGCTTADWHRPWCRLASLYAPDKLEECEVKHPGEKIPPTKAFLDCLGRREDWGHCMASTSNCQIPFTYLGVVYHGCTTKNHNGVLWCATETNKQRVMTGWENCPSCPIP